MMQWLHLFLDKLDDIVKMINPFNTIFQKIKGRPMSGSESANIVSDAIFALLLIILTIIKGFARNPMEYPTSASYYLVLVSFIACLIYSYKKDVDLAKLKYNSINYLENDKDTSL